MKWYYNLYVGETINKKKRKIIRNIKRGAGQLSIYVITLASNGSDLLDIFHNGLLMQPHFSCNRRFDKTADGIFIVGLAGSYDEAVEIATAVVMDVYQETGAFGVAQYIRTQQEKSGR